MLSNYITTTCLLLLLMNNHWSFVNAAPLDNNSGKEGKKDNEVKELESLKKDLVNVPPVEKEISVGKVSSSVYSNVNGHQKTHGEIKEQVSKDGKLFAKVSGKVDVSQDGNMEPKSKSKIELDIPSKGVHKSFVKDNGNVEVIDGQDFSNNGQRRSESSAENGIDKMNAFAGLEYTPLDMAEYIFWTGDEKGVILAIQEFLEEGLMSREEAINFLQSIKTNLGYMQEHYHGLEKTENRISANGQASVHDRLADLEKTQNYDYDSLPENDKMKSDSYEYSLDKYEASKVDPYERLAKYQEGKYENPIKLKSLLVRDSSNDRKKRFKDDAKNNNNGINLTDEDFEELLERLRVADFLYSEYSLEEIIYQLAKVVFSQSLTRDNTDAQLALQKFISFLEKEARLGRISKTLERKIIDILIAALSDTLSEHPQLLSAIKENLNNMEASEFSGPGILKSRAQGNGGNSLKRNRNLEKIPAKTESDKEPGSRN